MKYDLKAIMLRAWELFRKGGILFTEALRRAWLSAKNALAIERAKAEAGISEEVQTWAGWKARGREVMHGMKTVFQCDLIRGTGKTYRASFFTISQTQEGGEKGAQ